MKPTFFKGVVLGAVIAAVVSAGAVGFGAVTPFNLNTTANTVSAPTAASGSIAGNQFTLTDKSTSAGAPLALTNNSNATGATALKLTVKAGKAPFTVNSGTKVTNLNADRVDGIDSTGLIQGRGRIYTKTVAVARPSGNQILTYTLSPAVAPGFFNVGFECPGTGLSTIYIDVYNSSGGTENLFARSNQFPSPFYFAVPATQTRSFSTATTDITTLTMNGLPAGVQTTSTMTIVTALHASDCYFQLQAIIGS